MPNTFSAELRSTPVSSSGLGRLRLSTTKKGMSGRQRAICSAIRAKTNTSLVVGGFTKVTNFPFPLGEGDPGSGGATPKPGRFVGQHMTVHAQVLAIEFLCE